MSKSRLKPLYTIGELAEMAGVSRKRMVKILRAYGVEYLTAGPRYRMVPLSELREKVKPLYDSFKAHDSYEQFMGAARTLWPD